MHSVTVRCLNSSFPSECPTRRQRFAPPLTTRKRSIGGRQVQDRTLTCVDCGADFTYSVADQEFHASRGFTNEPKRCPDCRRARKSARGDTGMGGGGYCGGGGGGGGGYSSGPRQMYPAT